MFLPVFSSLHYAESYCKIKLPFPGQIWSQYICDSRTPVDRSLCDSICASRYPNDSMTELEQPSLRRVLEWIDGAALLIGVTIGAGIFATPQLIATYQSSFGDILWLWIGCGAFVIVGGLIYAELGTRVPATGGEYVYMYRAFGPFAGFMFGWAYFFIIRTSSAAGLSIITVNYFEYFVDLVPWQETVLALLVIAALGYINYIGIREASLFQKITTVLKVGGLFMLVLLGLVLVGGTESQLGTTAEPTATMGPVGNTVAAIMLVLFTYLGWDRVGYVAGEMKNPRKALPISIFVGLGIVTYTYILSNYVFHLTLGIEGVRGSTIVASDLATYFVGSAGAGIVAIIVIISATGSINGTMMAAPRAFYAMARDGLFFKWFNFVHPKHRTPSNAIIAYCAWAAVILLVRGDVRDHRGGHGVCRPHLLRLHDGRPLRAAPPTGAGARRLPHAGLSLAACPLPGGHCRTGCAAGLLRMGKVPGRSRLRGHGAAICPYLAAGLLEEDVGLLASLQLRTTRC